MDIDYNAIMQRFIQERKKFGSQEKLATIIDINPKSISAFETGRRKPSLTTFIKMCHAISADINYIIYGKSL